MHCLKTDKNISWKKWFRKTQYCNSRFRFMPVEMHALLINERFCQNVLSVTLEKRNTISLYHDSKYVFL